MNSVPAPPRARNVAKGPNSFVFLGSSSDLRGDGVGEARGAELNLAAWIIFWRLVSWAAMRLDLTVPI